MVSIVSFPLLVGSLMMKSIMMVSNGRVFTPKEIGYSGSFGWVVHGLVAWQVAHPLTNSFTSLCMVGH